MEKLRGSTIQQWFADFVDALQETQPDRSAIEPLVPEPTLWPVRSANSSARYH
jgi:trehalose 6-phosphate synthase